MASLFGQAGNRDPPAFDFSRPVVHPFERLLAANQFVDTFGDSLPALLLVSRLALEGGTSCFGDVVCSGRTKSARCRDRDLRRQ
ncbi:hypothetical protein [Halococcus sp. IIIV-5B]|uniref:hypothetical protein n=1 Tax=Halococcus sp. IIIV-5B TaxID=2321230 RepID=UPI0011C42F04|nr:hypothetical protein [Halococcus sp. IIIV-5B]